MRVAIFAPLACIRPHFETDLEIAQRHLDDGDEVLVLACDGVLPSCYPNPDHLRTRCLGCISRRQSGLSLLSRRVEVRSLKRLTPADRREIAALPTRFGSPRELSSFRIEGFDIGYAALSSVVTVTEDPEPDLEALEDLVRRQLVTGLTVYRSIQHHLDAGGIDRLVLFNGRVCEMRAALRACQQRGVDVVVHERGRDMHHFQTVAGAFPHDVGLLTERVRAAWRRGSEDREAIAADWFRRRAAGVDSLWFSFIGDQDRGSLPEGWSRERHNVVFFTSSEDELVAVSDDLRGHLFDHQTAAVEWLADRLGARGGRVHLTVRMHPNLRTRGSAQVHRMRGVRAPWLTVLGPEHPADSYALLHAADTVLTFGSTMGVEATFWGRPSVLGGAGLYQELGATLRARTRDELLDLLTRPLEPLDREPAMMLGYYLATLGQPFLYFQAASLDRGTFRGREVRMEAPLDAAMRVRRRLRRLVRPRRGRGA